MYEVCVCCDVSRTRGLTPLYSAQMGERAPPTGQIQVSSKLNVHFLMMGYKIKEKNLRVLCVFSLFKTMKHFLIPGCVFVYLSLCIFISNRGTG